MHSRKIPIKHILSKKTIEQYQFDTNLLSSREKYFNVMCNMKTSQDQNRDFEDFVWSSIANNSYKKNLCFHCAFGDILSISLYVVCWIKINIVDMFWIQMKEMECICANIFENDKMRENDIDSAQSGIAWVNYGFVEFSNNRFVRFHFCGFVHCQYSLNYDRSGGGAVILALIGFGWIERVLPHRLQSYIRSLGF